MMVLIAAVPGYVLGRWFDRLPATGRTGTRHPRRRRAQWWRYEGPLRHRRRQVVRRRTGAARRRPRGARTGPSPPSSGRRAAARPPSCGSSPGSSGPTRARSVLGDEVVDDAGRLSCPAEKRRIGYVPQEGALFPHLSVGAQRGLRAGRADRRRGRVEELLELVGLAGSRPAATRTSSPVASSSGWPWPARWPSEPDIVLLDEPFSSLDAALRASVRAEVHDVLRRRARPPSWSPTTRMRPFHGRRGGRAAYGRIAQIDTPAGLYGHPEDPELARFLGEANVLDGEVRGTVDRHRARPARPGLGRSPGRGTGPGSWCAPSRSRLGAVDGGGGGGVVRELRVLRPRRGGAGPARIGGPARLVVRVVGGVPLELRARGSGSRASGPVVAWPHGVRRPAKSPNNAPVTTPVSSGVH